MKHTGNLEITSGNAHLYAKLTEISGDLRVYGYARLDALQSVGGDLVVYGSATLDAPALQSVGGDLRVNGSATLDALQSVDGEDVSNGKIKFIETPVWIAICTPKMLRIGCQRRTWEEWIGMSNDEIGSLDENAAKIAKEYRAKLLKIHEELKGQ